MSSLARRQVLTTLAGLPLAAVLADPKLAAAAAAELEPTEIFTKAGRTVRGALAMPAQTPAPAVLLVHEWWGLNDQIKSVARELANQGYLALALDLYEGQLADNPEDARSYMNMVVNDEATDTVASWVDWLRDNPKGTGKVGTVGWCFGGGWSLNASIATPVNATIVYYGRVDHSVAQFRSLEGPVLGHFATEDNWITRQMVDGFEKNMKAAGKSYEVYWYEAGHAFANPTNARYDAGDAKLAWERTLAFYQKQLQG